MPGLAKYFKDGSDEERDHAQLLITFQVSPNLPANLKQHVDLPELMALVE